MRGKGTFQQLAVAMPVLLLLLETMLAKEDKNWIVLLWKTPRLSEMGRQGITVRTKWQSGIQVWQRLN